jgi:hypothetical protein
VTDPLAAAIVVDPRDLLRGIVVFDVAIYRCV